MKEVTTVSLGGVVLSLELDAKETINKYLDKNRTKLGGNEAAGEIIEDLEAAIGAHLLEKGYSDKRAASKTVIEALLQQMGEVDEDDAIQVARPSDWRRFFKESFHLSKTNKVIFGIAGSLAERIGIDAFWLRILFVILAFVTHGGFVGLYIITGLVVSVIEQEQPINAKTVSTQFRKTSAQTSEKMMSGWRKYLRQLDQIVRWVLNFIISIVASLGIVAGAGLLAWTYVTMLGRPNFDMAFVGMNRSALAYIFITSGLLLMIWFFGLLLVPRIFASLFKRKLKKLWIVLGLCMVTVTLAATFASSAFNLRTTIVDWGTRHPDQPFVQVQHWDNGTIYDVCVGVCSPGPEYPIHMIQQTDVDGHTTIITPPKS
jgi:phage shock protein PspC (stress-responsive transcriptional regulator)